MYWFCIPLQSAGGVSAARASLDLLLQGKVTAAEAVAAATAAAAGGGSLTAGGSGYDRGVGVGPARIMGAGLNQGVDSPPSSQVIAQLQQVRVRRMLGGGRQAGCRGWGD